MADLSYKVISRFVDLNGIMWGVRHSYSEADTLIKYSKEQHSPVSSTSIGTLQLGTPSLYEDHEKNSGLIADDSEGKYKETLDWRKYGSRGMEILKENLTKSLPGLRGNLKAKITWKLMTGFWLYCTSIDPKLSDKRIEQMKRTDPKYDYMSKIDDPSSFAKQLGYDFGRQIESDKDLKCDLPAYQMIISAANRQSGGMSDYSIFVDHGPVVYLTEEKAQEFINYASEKSDAPVVLFVKDKKYEVQQEYRFVVRVPFHSPTGEKFLLKVSEELKKLMSLV